VADADKGKALSADDAAVVDDATNDLVEREWPEPHRRW
jgi:hypothetical protein